MYPIIHQPAFNIEYNSYYRRIISLVPSQTELLASFGIDGRVIGITKYCVHPQVWLQSKPTIGGTKKLDIEIIKQLHPDLVIANKEENEKEQVNTLTEFCTVYVSEVNNLDSALEMILQVGLLTTAKLQAESLVHQIALDFEELASKQTNQKRSAAYFIWRKPYMVAASSTFINDMLQRCGLQNAFADQERYPVVTIEQLKKAHPQIVLLSSEPYPFQKKHVEELQILLPHSVILLVDGEMFSWYGSRMLQAAAYFSKWILPYC